MEWEGWGGVVAPWVELLTPAAGKARGPCRLLRRPAPSVASTTSTTACGHFCWNREYNASDGLCITLDSRQKEPIRITLQHSPPVQILASTASAVEDWIAYVSNICTERAGAHYLQLPRLVLADVDDLAVVESDGVAR